MASSYRWLVPLFLAVSSILAVVANSLLLLVFFKRRGLRTISNRFVINLLITNLLSSVVLVPLLVINENGDGGTGVANATAEFNISESTNDIFIDDSRFEAVFKTKLIETEDFIEIDIVPDRNAIDEHGKSNFLCYFSQIVTNLVCVSSIFGILLIGVDQYFAVIYPLRYHSYINKSKSLALLMSIWGLSLLIALLDLLVFDFSNFWRSCTAKRTANYKLLEVVYAYLYFVVLILVPFLAICLIYFKIYFAAHKSSERMRKSNSSSNSSSNQLVAREAEESVKARDLLPRIHSAPNITDFNAAEAKKVTRSISDRTNTNSIIISLKSKISNASVFRYREETRAARISILVIFMVLICYFPYGATIIANSYRNDDNPNYAFNFVSIVLLILSNIASPFLFAYRNKRIQRELVRLFLPRVSVNKKDIVRKRASRIVVVTEAEPCLNRTGSAVPEVVVTLSAERQQEKKSILKRVCSKTWSYKTCNFISVPDSCLEARASFSSASTQISSAED